jgi:hypothetical protein
MKRGLAVLLALAACACRGGAERTESFKTPAGFTLRSRLRCDYREGQSITDHGGLRVVMRQKPNSKPLSWEFADLFQSMGEARFLGPGGGSTARTLAYVTPGAVSLVLPQKNGVHVFTVWTSGVSVWTKHDTVNGLLGANQFLGSCTNLEEKK